MYKLMSHIDSAMLKLGLCRTAHFNDMKSNYAKVISMCQRQAQRLKETNEALTRETLEKAEEIETLKGTITTLKARGQHVAGNL